MERHDGDLVVRLADGAGPDRVPVVGEGRDHGPVRDHVDHARHAARQAVDPPQRGPGEDGSGLSLARDREAVLDVGPRLLPCERPDVPAQRDALVQLHELGVEKERAQLRLTDEDDAQELLGGRLEIRQESELLEHLDGQRLRLVDHDDRAAARFALLQQVTVERAHQLGAAVRVGMKSELGIDRLQELERREDGVEDVRGFRVGNRPGQERAQERRLPRAHVAGDADEAARLRQAELQVCEGVGVLARQEQVARVRRQPERRVGEPEEPLVHPSRPWESLL